MQYRNLGNAGIKVSAVALGGYTTFGDSIQDLGLARRIILAAYESGINFFDIADQYAYGESERMMGAVLLDLPRHTLVISSKVFWPMSEEINDRGLSRKHIIESVEKSLKRIGTDYLDIYFCHRMDPEVAIEETTRAMEDLIRQGKVLYWGTSVWSGDGMRQAHAVADKRNAYAPVVEQPMFHLLDRGVAGDVIPTAQELGMGVVVWSPLAGGILTGKYNDGVPPTSRAATTQWLESWLTPENLARVKELSGIAAQLDITTAQLALAWVLHQPGISSVITGASRPAHVESNLVAADVELDADTLARIDRLFPA